jgi:hypothetical protein
VTVEDNIVKSIMSTKTQRGMNNRRVMRSCATMKGRKPNEGWETTDEDLEVDEEKGGGAGGARFNCLEGTQQDREWELYVIILWAGMREDRG